MNVLSEAVNVIVERLRESELKRFFVETRNLIERK